MGPRWPASPTGRWRAPSGLTTGAAADRLSRLARFAAAPCAASHGAHRPGGRGAATARGQSCARKGDLLEVRFSVVGERTASPSFEGTVTGPAADPAGSGRFGRRSHHARRVLRTRRARQAEDAAFRHQARRQWSEFLSGRGGVRPRCRGSPPSGTISVPFSSTPLSCSPAGDWATPVAGCPSGPSRRIHPVSSRCFTSTSEAVPEVDRHLIEAQFQPSGAPRFEQYEQAMLVAGDDAYAPLLYGDELFHRGPLAGRSLREAVEMLERAVAADSTLAPAWEHLAWAIDPAGRCGARRLGPGAARAMGGRARRSPRSTCPPSSEWLTPSASATPRARDEVTGLAESVARALRARGARGDVVRPAGRAGRPRHRAGALRQDPGSAGQRLHRPRRCPRHARPPRGSAGIVRLGRRTLSRSARGATPGRPVAGDPRRARRAAGGARRSGSAAGSLCGR